ncbi:hypothetical protein EB093_04525 [bacterium]|nr:hypothetical protein [bacterium]
MRAPLSIWIRRLSPLLFPAIWWTVAIGWKYSLPLLAVAGVTVFLGMASIIDRSPVLWRGALAIAAMGLVSDWVYLTIGILPPVDPLILVSIAGLWICFGWVMMGQTFSKLPVVVQPIIGGIGGWLNYHGLGMWLHWTSSSSLSVVGIQWAVMFPIMIWITSIGRAPNQSTLGVRSAVRR